VVINERGERIFVSNFTGEVRSVPPPLKSAVIAQAAKHLEINLRKVHARVDPFFHAPSPSLTAPAPSPLTPRSLHCSQVNERVDEDNPLNINIYGAERAEFFGEIELLARQIDCAVVIQKYVPCLHCRPIPNPPPSTSTSILQRSIIQCSPRTGRLLQPP